MRKRWMRWTLAGLTLLVLAVVGISLARSELKRGIMGSLGSGWTSH